MPSVGFEPAIPAIERPQIYALDRTAIGIGNFAINFTYVTDIMPNKGSRLNSESCGYLPIIFMDVKY
jgi:hypothetical protein